MNEDAKQSQVDKFKEAARELETDDNEDRFNATLGKLAKSPPAPQDGKPAKGSEKPLKQK